MGTRFEIAFFFVSLFVCLFVLFHVYRYRYECHDQSIQADRFVDPISIRMYGLHACLVCAVEAQTQWCGWYCGIVVSWYCLYSLFGGSDNVSEQAW